MWSVIEEIAKHIPNGVYCLLVLLLILIVVKIVSFYFKRFCPLEKQTGDVVTDIKTIKEDINGIRENILHDVAPLLNKISTYLITKYPRDKELLKIQSPIELTELAKEILEKSGAKNFVDSSLDSLIAKIKEGNPKSDLDIYQLAASVLFNLVDTNAFTKIKDFIYQNPKYNGKHDLDIQIMINLSALYLRDRYLAQVNSKEIKKVEPTI